MEMTGAGTWWRWGQIQLGTVGDGNTFVLMQLSANFVMK